MSGQEEINVFLRYSRKISGLDPFLIEPFLLYNFLDEQNQTYFIAKNLNPHVFQWKYDFSSFGLKVPGNLTKDQRAVFLAGICEKDLLTEFNLECSTLYGDDNTKEWQLNETIETSREKIPISFLFTYKPSGHRIHLVLFYLRTRSLWTGKINSSKDLNELIVNEGANIKFGLYEELFDDFAFIRPIRDIQIPEDPLNFLMEKNNSR